MHYRIFLLFALSFFSISSFCREIQTNKHLELLYKRFDTDKDKKITLDDKISPGTSYEFKWMDKKYTASGLYQISNLAQELKLGQLTGKKLDPNLINENPVERISRSIKDRFWDGLTRRIDASTIKDVIGDPKIDSKVPILYIPFNDKEALEHFKNSDVKVVRLPKKLPENFISTLGKNQGLLALGLKDGKGIPYVVPGGRFNEMYGWDSYFHLLGTLIDGRLDLAKGMVDNFVYEINHYGQILNANRTYYLTRSQPPFLTSMITEVYKLMPKNTESKEWLKHSVAAAIKEYDTVWMGKDRLTPIGLSRYAGFDTGIPPEVEEGHFNHVLKPFAKKHKLSVQKLADLFNKGKIKDNELIEFFHQDRAVRESGHDTTFRWRVEGEDRASDFVTVDLNSLLYEYETNLARILAEEFSGKLGQHTARKFQDAAVKRKVLMRKYLWNADRKMFFDYNWKDNKPSDYVSATTFYPLWTGTDLLSADEAKDLTKTALKYLEQPGGISATAEVSLIKYGNPEEERQWEYPNGWAPHQILAWQGMKNFELEKDKNRLIYKWLYMITRNAMDYNGTIPEKYDVVAKSHKVFAEYGNVGTKFSYITLEGFGWMNASYQIGLQLLPEKHKEQLKNLVPPEKVVF